MFILFSSILLFTGLAHAETPSISAKRWALVVTSSGYVSLPKLRSAAIEGDRMREVLSKAGFEVKVVNEMRLPDFYRDEEEFTKKIQPGDICVFYFSGYGIQGDAEDNNYLLPVNFDPQSENDLQERGYPPSRMLSLLDRKKAGLSIFVLEASRSVNRPIRGAGRPGLMEAQIRKFKEALFEYSTGLGQTTPANTDSVGLFTEVVAKSIEEPGLRVVDVFEKAKQEVTRRTLYAQIPYLNHTVLTSDFYFHRLPDPPRSMQKTKQEPVLGFPVQNKRDRLEYVWIPPGRFQMGCVVDKDQRCAEHETPQHAVTISKGFWMGRTEVTVEAYKRFVERNKDIRMPPDPDWDKHWATTNFPIANVKWDEAQNYCSWAGGRLPTEAEWERAARAGVDNEVFPLNDENSREKANFAGKSGNDRFDFAAPVMQFDANKFGLYDMAGNLWEWVSDFYSADYYDSSPSQDPTGPIPGKQHVARGGSFASDPKQHLRISFREHFGKGGNALGFRCVLSDGPETRKVLALPEPSGVPSPH